MLKTWPLFAAAAAGTLLAGCHPVRTHHDFAWTKSDWTKGVHLDSEDAPLSVADRLNCPEQEGDMRRVDAAPNGADCRYSNGDGREIDLKLVKLNGETANLALQPIEAELTTAVPLKGVTDLVSVNSEEGGPNGDHAKVDLPGIHIDAGGNHAHLKIFGADINAEGDTGTAEVKTNLGVRNTRIHAGPGGAEIRAGGVGKNAADLLYVRAGDATGPDGWRAVGYRARGPVQGPLVVAEFRAKDRSERGDGEDLERLIDLNVKSGPAST